MLLSHHLMSGPQFSSHPKYSGPCLSGSGGAGGAGGTGGEGAGEGGAGGAGGVGGPGGAGGEGGAGGAGAGAGGTLAQSPFPLHFFLKSSLHSPPAPLDGYPPQLEASPHLLKQHEDADARAMVRANAVATVLNAIELVVTDADP